MLKLLWRHTDGDKEASAAEESQPEEEVEKVEEKETGDATSSPRFV